VGQDDHVAARADVEPPEVVEEVLGRSGPG
jgi:hypothetical protein